MYMSYLNKWFATSFHINILYIRFLITIHMRSCTYNGVNIFYYIIGYNFFMSILAKLHGFVLTKENCSAPYSTISVKTFNFIHTLKYSVNAVITLPKYASLFHVRDLRQKSFIFNISLLLKNTLINNL